MPRSDFEKELEQLINRHSRERHSGTPDFILAIYMMNCLRAYEHAIYSRQTWMGNQASSAITLVTAEDTDK